MSGIAFADGDVLVDGEPLRAAFTHQSVVDITEPEFHTRHFHAVTEGGWTFSVVWGSCSYSDNYGNSLIERGPFCEPSSTVEIMAWNLNGDHPDPSDPDSCGNPAGWVPVANLVALLTAAQSWPTTPDERTGSEWRTFTDREVVR